jgi:hypothetical protein
MYVKADGTNWNPGNGAGPYMYVNAAWVPMFDTSGVAPNTFGTVAVSGQSDVVADASADTLTLAAGSDIAITTNVSTDTVTVSSTATSRKLSEFAATSSSELASVISDETGTGALVFANTPTVTALKVAAGTATANTQPIELTSGTLLTAAEAGSIEYDGTAPYFSVAASARGVVPAIQLVALTSTYTLANSASLQKLFNVPSNGALTVAASTTYFFECQFSLSSMSASSGNLLFDVLGAGTATVTSAGWSCYGRDASAIGTAGAAIGGIYAASNTSSGDIVVATANTNMFATITGILRINAGGTIIPSVALTNAAAAVVGVNSWFRIYPVGSNTVTSVGNWA